MQTDFIHNVSYKEPAPATLDLASLVEQLQKSPELGSALAALIAAHKNLPVTKAKLPGEVGTKNAANPEKRLAAVLSGVPERI